jgi:methyl-accepting chemotaxis protein
MTMPLTPRPTDPLVRRRAGDLPVAARIAAVVTALGVVTVTVTGLAAVRINGLAESQHQMFVETVRPMDDLQAVQRAFQGIRVRVGVYATADEEARAAIVDDIEERQATITETLATYRDFEVTPGFVADFTAASTTYYAAVADELLPRADAGDLAGFGEVYLDQVKSLGDDSLDVLTAESDAQAVVAGERDAEGQDAARAAVLTVVVVALLGLVVAGALALVVARGVVGGVRRVQRVALALADGDLTATSGITSRDEVGVMAGALDHAVEALRELFVSVSSSSAAVASAAEELTAAASEISAAAEETSAQSGVVAAAADEVSRGVATAAAGSEEMGVSIREIAQNAGEAARVAVQAVELTDRADRSIAQLGESSQGIGDVVRTITSIAEQTNLLALNATIEAARAGDAGKGFAVVAHEVKELAQETARATEDISRRVAAIQADTGGAVSAITEISGIIASISDFQTTIASAVEEQTATTNEMSRSVQQASSGAGEIALNISGVSTAAQSTTESLAQTRTAVAELAELASGLQERVSRFRY